jgi:hypothetical protein
MYTTDLYEGVLAETVTMAGADGDLINAYLARPLGKDPCPAQGGIRRIKQAWPNCFG